MRALGTEVERLDHLHLRQIVVQLVFYALSLVLILIRFLLGALGLGRGALGSAVFGLMIAALVALAACSAIQLRVWRRISRDPELASALNNEMVQSLGAEAWLWGFLGAAGSVIFYAIASFGGLVGDPVTIALTTIVAGRGAQRAAFFLKYRSA